MFRGLWKGDPKKGRLIKVVLTLDPLRSSFSLTPSNAVLIIVRWLMGGVGIPTEGKTAGIRNCQ